METSWRPLGSSWRRLGAPKSTGGGWRRLEAAGGGCTRLEAGAVAEEQGPLLGRKDSERIRIIRKEYNKEVRWDRRLEYGTLYAMRRHKAWRGGSNAQQSCVPATALSSYLFVFCCWRLGSLDGWMQAKSVKHRSKIDNK